jgi:hypothetical protein
MMAHNRPRGALATASVDPACHQQPSASWKITVEMVRPVDVSMDVEIPPTLDVVPENLRGLQRGKESAAQTGAGELRDQFLMLHLSLTGLLVLLSYFNFHSSSPIKAKAAKRTYSPSQSGSDDQP